MSRRVGLIFLTLFTLLLFGCGGGPSGGDSDADGVKPAAGGFGGRLQQGATFSVVLFVLEGGSGIVDLVGIACASQGTINSNVVTVGERVKADGKFNSQSKDVKVEGEFLSITRAEGTARALGADAEGCGIDKEARWVSVCDLTVTKEEQKESEDGFVIGGSSATTENGHAFGHVEVVTRGGDRLIGDLIKSGSCGQA